MIASDVRHPPHAGGVVTMEIDDAASEGTAHRPPLLVLSRDAAVVETVRKAAPRGTPFTHSPDLDGVADRLPALNPGVLVVDATQIADVASMLAQLTQHFPELVLVVTGASADRAALMQLTAAGSVFRFLLKPLSHGQTRLVLEAATARHLELAAASHRLGSAPGVEGTRNYLIAYGTVAAALIVAIGAIWAAVSVFTGDPKPAVPPPAVVQAESLIERPDPVQAELTLAKEAFDQGRYLAPRGDSALDLYRSAQALDPRNEAAAAGIRAVADKILEGAEAALTNGRLEDAVRSIETARDIDAAHPRLSFLDLQVAREGERLSLTRALDTGQRVSTLVARASERMREGRLIAPAAGSARDALLEARRLDPTDPTVVQGIRDLSETLTEEARKALVSGDMAEAQRYADAARALGSAGSALAAVEQQLAETRRRNAAAASTASVSAPPSAVAPPMQTPSTGRPSEDFDGGGLTGAAVDPASRPAAAAADDEAGVLQAADLPRIREVPAEYPYVAASRGTEGWVDIEFTLSPAGIPQDLQVRDAQPARVFDRAALDALRQWRFEPVVRDGVPVARRAILRVRFQLK